MPQATITLEALRGLATHSELVLARERVRLEDISEYEALCQALEQNTEALGLEAVVQVRLAAKAARQRRHAQLEEDCRLAERGAWRAWFDGAARPTPGAQGIGAVLEAPSGEYFELSQAIGYGSSTEAEYWALIVVLEAAVIRRVDRLIVRGDSRPVINQVAGWCRVNPVHLKVLCRRARRAAARIDRVELVWIPRRRNRHADRLSKWAIREGEAIGHPWEGQFLKASESRRPLEKPLPSLLCAPANSTETDPGSVERANERLFEALPGPTLQRHPRGQLTWWGEWRVAVLCAPGNVSTKNAPRASVEHALPWLLGGFERA